MLSFVLLVSSSIGQAENLTPFDQTDVGSGFGLNFETTTAEQKEVEAITIANSYEESNISTTKDSIEAAISESFESDTVSSSVKDWPTSEVEGSGGEVVIEAGSGEDQVWPSSEVTEEVEVVETLNYKMSSSARLGNLDVRLDHLSDGRVRLVLVMEDSVDKRKEETTESNFVGLTNDQTTENIYKERSTEVQPTSQSTPPDHLSTLSPVQSTLFISDEENTTPPIIVTEESLTTEDKEHITLVTIDKDASVTEEVSTFIPELVSNERGETTFPAIVTQVPMTQEDKVKTGKEASDTETATTEMASTLPLSGEDNALTTVATNHPEEVTTNRVGPMLPAVVAKVVIEVEDQASVTTVPTSALLEKEIDASVLRTQDKGSEANPANPAKSDEEARDGISMFNRTRASGGVKAKGKRGSSRTPRSVAKRLQRWDFLPATIFLIEDQAACSDMDSAARLGLYVNALPLAQITRLGSDEETVGVSWEDVKRGKCLAILKPLEVYDDNKILPTTSVKAPRQLQNGNILKTAGLSRTFGAINLASFTVLSVGVTGMSKNSWKRNPILKTNIRSSCSCRCSIRSLCCFFLIFVFFLFFGFTNVLVGQRSYAGSWSRGFSSCGTALLSCQPEFTQ